MDNRKQLEFSFSLFNKLASGNDNLIISPVSIYESIAILANGVSDRLKKDVLDIISDYDINTLNDFLSTNNNECLKKSNLVIAKNSEGLKVKENFYNVIKNKYNGDVVFIKNFDDSCVSWINNYISNKTNNMVNNFFNKIENDTEVMSINTLYFEDLWKKSFEDIDIFDSSIMANIDKFKNSDNSLSNVVYLDVSNKGIVKRGTNEQAIVVPYKNGCSFIGILPNEEGDIKEFIKTFDYEEYKKLMSFDSIKYEIEKNVKLNVEAKIIEFESEYKNNVTEYLKQLGFNKLYNEENVLNNMLNKNLKLFKSMHGAKIKVDRYGTKAGAVTVHQNIFGSLLERRELENIVLLFNRPFMWMVIDENLIPLFMGYINKI